MRDGPAANSGERQRGVGEEGGCAFVLGEARHSAGEAILCNAPRRLGSAYCPRHHAVCYLAAGSASENRRLREIEALAAAVGGRRGRVGREPPPNLLRRLAGIERSFSSAKRS